MGGLRGRPFAKQSYAGAAAGNFQAGFSMPATTTRRAYKYAFIQLRLSRVVAAGRYSQPTRPSYPRSAKS